MDIRMARVYAPVLPGEVRVLVDRLWPRGFSKEGAPWQLWLREAAPSSALRSWYHAHPDERDAFCRRYREELSGPEGEAAVARLADLASEGGLVLVTAHRDVERSHVPVVRDVVWERCAAARGPGAAPGGM